jgi:hypothetical protein
MPPQTFNVFKSLTMKTLIKILLVPVIAIGFGTGMVQAQQTPKQIEKAAKIASLQKAVEGRKYTFVAQYALPLRGGQKYLTGDYDLRITRDSAIAYLPYFGRVYMDPPTNPDDAGIMFTATKFDYKAENRKKGGWDITIVPKNIRYTTKMMLQVFADGTAYLQVTSYNRDQISFNGFVKENK